MQGCVYLLRQKNRGPDGPLTSYLSDSTSVISKLLDDDVDYAREPAFIGPH
jgi:hypothetical protein